MSPETIDPQAALDLLRTQSKGAAYNLLLANMIRMAMPASRQETDDEKATRWCRGAARVAIAAHREIS